MDDKVVELLKKTVKDISDRFSVEILNIEADKDHFHMLFKAKPTLDITKYFNAVKCISSREIQRNFPAVKRSLKKNVFWSPSYFLATTGQVSLPTLMNYVSNQKVKRCS